jgi:outer membrane protein assembly factor BamB
MEIWMRALHLSPLIGAVALVPAALVPAASCHAAPVKRAAMFRGDPQLTGVIDAPPPRGLAGVRFRFHAEGPIRGTPAFAAGLVLFGSDDGHFYAVDARSGVLRWRFAAGAGIASSAAVVDGVVFFTAFDGALYALDAASGALRWKRAFGRDLGTMNYWDFYTSSPTPFGDALYVGSGDGHLYAVDRASGRTRWAYDAGARIRGAPAVTEASVVIGTMAGHVVAVDRRSGARRWDFATDGAGNDYARKHNDTTAVAASPAIHDGVVVAGGRDGYLYAIDLASGRQRWKTTHDGGSWMLSVGIQGQNVLVGGGSALIVQSAGLADGHEQWRFKTGGAIFGAAAVAGDVLVADDMRGTVHAVDTASGKELWHFPLGDLVFAGPLIADGAVFAASDSGTLVALDTTTVAAAPMTAVRYIHYNTQRGPNAPEWLTNTIGLVTDFVDAGYKQATDETLVRIMNAQIAGGGDAVIVFADPHLPAAATETSGGASLLRRYLDAGGKAVFLGFNPWAFKYDATTGELSGIDDELGAAATGIKAMPRPLDYGYHVSRYTAEGQRLGLSGSFVTSGVTVPEEVTSVLARDRIGYATAWTRRYGARGMLIQLPVPRNRLIDTVAIRAAIDLASRR